MSTYPYRGVNAHLAQCLHSIFNVKVLVGAFNQEKALRACENRWTVSSSGRDQVLLLRCSSD